MITFLKNVGNKKYSELKNKSFEEIQALYEKVKRFNESFTAVGSIEDAREIKKMNKEAKDHGQKTYKRRIAKVIAKSEDTVKEDDDDEVRLCLIVVSDEDREMEYDILDKMYPIIEWKSMCLGTKPQYDETEGIAKSIRIWWLGSNDRKDSLICYESLLSIYDKKSEDLKAFFLKSTCYGINLSKIIYLKSLTELLSGDFNVDVQVQ
ncbi:hypothetical protein Tco_0111776 [Tanacetum coccineum]